MTLIQTIKADQLIARKARKVVEAASLTTLIGEAEAVGKNNGNREPTDQEVVSMLKKFIKNAHEVNRIAGDYRDSARCDEASAEIELFEAYLPQQLSEAQLAPIIKEIIELRSVGVPGVLPKMGAVVADLKVAHEGQYDGAMAARLIKEALS